MNPASTADALALLRQLAASLGTSASLEAGLERATAEIRSFTGWPYAEVWTPSADHRELRCLHTSAGDDLDLQGFRDRALDLVVPHGLALPGRVLASRRPIWHPDVTVLPPDEFARCIEAAEAGLKAGFGVPVVARDRVLAVFTFFFPAALDADWELVDAVSLVATQLGALLDQHRLEQQLSSVSERLADTEDRLGVVREVIGTAQHGDVQSLLNTLAEVARTSMSATHASVFTVDETGAPERYAYAGPDRRGADYVRTLIEAWHAPAEMRDRERALHITNPAEVLGRTSEDVRPPVTSLLLAPIRVDGELAALVCVGRAEGQPPFTAADAARIEDLALQMAVGLSWITAQTQHARLSALEARLRIMTEIQDDIIQNLFGLGLQLDSLASRPQSEDNSHAITESVERVNSLIGEARRYLAVLAGGETIEEADLMKGLASLMRQRIPAGTSSALNIRSDGIPALERQEVGNLLLIAREAFDNAAEHSGAGRIGVSLQRIPEGVELVIQDDGVGFDEDSTPPGAGLAAMEAAARRLDGTVSVFSIPGMGTTVRVVVPRQ